MTEFIWPLAVIAISTIFFLIFRVPLSTLIKRTKSIGRDGLDATHDESFLAHTNGEDSDVVANLLKAHLAEIERIEQRHEERYTKIIEPLQQAAKNQSEQMERVTARIDTIEGNRVIKKMLAAPPLKSDAQ